MLKEERQNYILDKLRQHNKVKSNDLSVELNVSEDTVRRDLNQLSYKGLLLKVHGGALSTHQKLYHYNKSSVFNRENKTKVAKKVMPLLKNGQKIIVSGGTTNLEFARLIPEGLKLKVYTFSLTIAMQLTEHPNVEVILIGGKIDKEALVTVGVNVIKGLSQIKADLCFLGTSGIDIDEGFTEVGYEVSFIKRVVIASSNKVVVLTTSDKLNTSQRYPVCDLSDIDILITDLDNSSPELHSYIKEGIEVL